MDFESATIWKCALILFIICSGFIIKFLEFKSSRPIKDVSINLLVDDRDNILITKNHRQDDRHFMFLTNVLHNPVPAAGYEEKYVEKEEVGPKNEEIIPFYVYDFPETNWLDTCGNQIYESLEWGKVVG